MALTPGVGQKPDYCYNSCPLSRKGTGFVADHVGRSPLLAFIFPSPTKMDTLSRKPLSSYSGLFWYTVLKPLGLTMDNIIVSHVLRCNNWRYPVAAERKCSELACRAYDTVSRDLTGLPTVATGLRTWDPNWFVLTYDMSDARTLEAYQALFMADVAKALRFARSGFRPCVLAGGEPMELYAPWLTGTGGLRKHRGDWWEGSLPYEATAPPVLTYNTKLVTIDKAPARKKPAPVQGSLF